MVNASFLPRPSGWLGVTLASAEKRPIAVINPDLFSIRDEAKREQEVLRVLAHELTHAYQSLKYKWRHYINPKWKTEGHASLAEQQIASTQKYAPFFLTQENPKFSFHSEYDHNDYSAAFIQCWYYYSGFFYQIFGSYKAPRFYSLDGKEYPGLKE